VEKEAFLQNWQLIGISLHNLNDTYISEKRKLFNFIILDFVKNELAVINTHPRFETLTYAIFVLHKESIVFSQAVTEELIFELE